MFCFASQEGANINKSLTTLGKVISALAELVGARAASVLLSDEDLVRLFYPFSLVSGLSVKQGNYVQRFI